jgi:CubicO group peptidase (beta-lactamase class C family)
MMRMPQRLPQMHRPPPILTLIVSILLGTVLVRAADDLVLDRFGGYLESLRTQAGIPGLAAIIVGARDVMWERGFGRENVERSMTVKTITPFHLDGLTQIVTASLVLRCAEDHHLSLDDRIDHFKPDASEGGATVQQVLSHTSGSSKAPVFAYRPERLDVLAAVIAACTGDPFRKSVARLLEQNAMIDSVPGPDSASLPTSDGFDQSTVDHYRDVLGRLAVGYAVSTQGTASATSYSARTLTPSSGLIASARDLAQFDLSLKRGVLLSAESISLAWRAPVDANGRRLPHGLGWFVQSYNGETIVWQFGSGSASSSMVLMVPGRGLTLILLANSTGLTKGFNLAAGDVSVSPFAKAFLGTFLR